MPEASPRLANGAGEIRSVGGGETGPARVLRAALERAAANVRAQSHDEWRFRLPGTRRSGHARLSTRWLSLRHDLRASQSSRSADAIADAALRRNASIRGIARLVGPGPRHALTIDLPADVLPWDSTSGIEQIVSEALDDLRAAAGARVAASRSRSALDAPTAPALQDSSSACRETASPVASLHAPSSDSPPNEALPQESLAALFEQASWPARSSEGEALDVPLDVPGHYVTASVGCTARAVRLRVPLLTGELASASAPSRAAVGLLIWRAASRIRLVKAARFAAGPTLEAALPRSLAEPAALVHACAALSLALGQLIGEAKALIADERLASLYLSFTDQRAPQPREPLRAFRFPDPHVKETHDD